MFKIDNGSNLVGIIVYKEFFKTTYSHSGIVRENIAIHLVSSLLFFSSSQIYGFDESIKTEIITESEKIKKFTGSYPNQTGVLKIKESCKYST